MTKRHVRPARVLVLILVALAVLAVPAAAQDDLPWWGSYYMPGNVALSATVNAWLRNGFTAGLYPGAEVIVAKVRPADAFALDIGVGARGFFEFSSGTQFSSGWLGFGAGPLVTVHLGFRGYSSLADALEYLEPVDLFTGLGVDYRAYAFGGGTGTVVHGLGITNYTGINYFLTDRLAITAMSAYYFGITGAQWRPGFRGSIGVTLKTGPKEALGEAPRIERVGVDLEGNIVYLGFASMYWSLQAFTGWYADDLNYEVGDETRFRITYRDNRDEERYTYTRSLLHRNPDGTSWWRLEVDWTDMDDDTLPTVYEFLVNEQYDVLRLRYMDPARGLSTFEPRDPAAWRGRVGQRVDDPGAYAERLRSEQVRVEAGSFRTDVYRSRDESAQFTWWLTDDVPGTLVKLEGRTTDGYEVDGELVRIRRGVTSPWTPAW